MAKWQFITFIVVIFRSLSLVFSVPCLEDYCDDIDCKAFNASTCDLIFPRATPCGCCDICIEYLEENENCIVLTPQELSMPIDRIRKHCGPQLVCEDQVCKKQKTKCLNSLKKYNDDKENDGWLQIGNVRPQCDDYGNYLPVQCQPGSQCFCVNKEGQRIFGESTSKEAANCACSRDLDAIRQVVQTSSLGEWLKEPWGPLEHFLRCSATGDYDALQCVDDRCFCINGTLEVYGGIQAKEHFTRLICYKPLVHLEKYERACEEELFLKANQAKSLMAAGKIVVGIDFPSCDLDGTYSPKQCKDDICFCSDKEGMVINNYVAQRYSPEAEAMICNCAREKLFLNQTDLTKKLYCNELGNYKERQCLGLLCYCVNENGIQTSKEFDTSESTPDRCPGVFTTRSLSPLAFSTVTLPETTESQTYDTTTITDTDSTSYDTTSVADTDSTS